MDEGLEQILATGRRFNQEDIDKIDRLCNVMGRCHEMVNKVESLFGLRPNIHQMENVSNIMFRNFE